MGLPPVIIHLKLKKMGMSIIKHHLIGVLPNKGKPYGPILMT